MGVDPSGLFEPGYLDDDEMTALVGADIPRVDLVEMGANGVPRFLIAKQANGARGLMDAAFVRDLIGEPQPVVKHDGETVTMSGSPAAIARFIHQAAERADAPVVKAVHDTEDRGRDATDGNTDGTPKGDVAKETDVADDLDPTVVLAEPDGDTPGMPTSPGSPAWEAVDAATARKWTAILARAKAAVDLLADREMMEAAGGDGDEGDACQAMDLQDACCAIDYAISVLAPFAVAEQAEADCCDDMAMVGKALAGFDPAQLDLIEALGHVRKAGRVLSTANEAAIRGAVESLQKVLASLPAAPTADDSGQPVAKTEETPVTAAVVAEPAAPVVCPPAVVKADAEGKAAMRAVYDAKGRLVGIVDPTDITPIEDAGPEPDTEPAADDAAPAEADMQPAPAATVGVPADAVPDDGVAKQTDKPTEQSTSSTTDAIAKSIAEVVKAQLDAHSAAQQEVLAKMAGDLACAAETIGVLKGQVEALEEQPATPRVFTSGAVPPAHLLRGQDRGGQPADVARVAELRKGLYSPVVAERDQAALGLNELAVVELQEIHQRRR